MRKHVSLAAELLARSVLHTLYFGKSCLWPGLSRAYSWPVVVIPLESTVGLSLPTDQSGLLIVTAAAYFLSSVEICRITCWPQPWLFFAPNSGPSCASEAVGQGKPPYDRPDQNCVLGCVSAFRQVREASSAYRSRSLPPPRTSTDK